MTTSLSGFFMNIILNTKPTNTAAQTVAELIAEMGLPTTGVAVAIDMQMVSRQLWEETLLHENDDVTVIVAACGG